MGFNFQARQTRWDVLNANLKTHLEELPRLTDGQAELEKLINEDLALVAQQSQLTAKARDIVVQRRALAKEGNRLREFLAAGLRHRLGPESQKLVEFGVKPQARKKKKKSPDTNGGGEPPVTPPTPPVAA